MLTPQNVVDALLDEAREVSPSVAKEIADLRQYRTALDAVGPVHPGNPGAAKKHRQATLAYAATDAGDVERKERYEQLFRELNLDF